METTLDKTQLKALITEVLIDLLQNNRELFREILLEAVEEVGLANAIKEAENDEAVDESQILAILAETRQLRNSIPVKGQPLSHSIVESRSKERY